MLVYRKSLFVSIFSFINTFCYTTENNNRFLSKPISSSKVEGAYEAQNQSALDIHEGHLEKSQIPPKPHENSSIEATNKFAEEAKEIELRKKSNKSPPIFEYNSSIKRISCNINFKNIPQFIIKEFEKWSLLMKEQKNGLVSEKVATKDAKKDKKILKKLFIRFGYFDVDIKTKIDFDSNKATIYYIAAPGERYKVSDKKIEFLNSTQNFSPIEHIIFVLRGEKIDFSKIESEQKKIQVYFKKIGYFFAEVKNPV
ncbi:MAG: hypothetical protein LBS83_02110, partial [Holosporales bacterium]|nr:hypothetical protein [Holosporales bacterium]